MPRSSGTYAAPASSWYPAVASNNATTSDWNALLADISSALTTSVAVDGTATITGNIPMAGFKFTGLATGSSAADSVRYDQLTTGYQPLDATLTTVAALTPTTDQGIYFSGTDIAATYALVSYGRTLAGLANAAALSAQVTTGYGFTPIANTRLISTGTGLTGGGDLSADRTHAVDKASAAQYQAATANKILDAANVRAAAAETALTDGANIAVDMSTGISFSVTLAGNRTLSNPTNTQAGTSGMFVIAQDATGSRTLAFSSSYKFAGGAAPTLSTGANKVDYLSYYVHDSTHILISTILDVR